MSPEVDPLVANGLGSPSCEGRLAQSVLPPSSRRNCETSGFLAAGAPTGNYGIDVHIDTGVLGLSSGGLLSAVQDVIVTPLWMALVWAVHSLVVMLEWSFTLDLLDSSSASGVTAGLRTMEATFTAPWLALALSLAGVLAAYHGLIRRRVADTLGESLLALTMIAGGLWVIADPGGTVGAVGSWADQASVGTLAVAARGTPAAADGVLGASMSTVFASGIEAPWCYLEFGEVSWCRDPALLDGRLRSAGEKIASSELAEVACAAEAETCVARGSDQAKVLEHSAALLRGAASNGALFLALPANGPARNSINQEGSLLRTLCGSSEATHCRGPTAAQAEFRTNNGTWSRVGGLLLIVAGLLGLLLLLGYIALHLLTAALFSLLYLLLAPAMVLAPALGETGRAAFRGWAARLLGALVAKLLFAFLLGIVLAVVSILSSLRALGWWTQWLLMSAFWWAAFARRHLVSGLAGTTTDGARPSGGVRRSGLSRRVDAAYARYGSAGAAKRARERRRRPAPDVSTARAERTARDERSPEPAASRLPTTRLRDPEPPAREPRHGGARPSEPSVRPGEPDIMRDARAVAEGRKRQLGIGRE